MKTKSTRLFLPLAILASTAARISGSNLDQKSLSIARRIIQKLSDYEQPPPSWDVLLRVLEHSFLGEERGATLAAAAAASNTDVYRSSPQEEEARARAVQWLAHDDDVSPTSLSEESYDRELLPRYALATLYFATGGDHWSRCSQKQQSSKLDTICESDEERYLSPHSHGKWDGVNAKRDGQVIWLDLSGRGLTSGTFLPLELTIFSPSLEVLWVSENEQLEGTLPSYLREFKSLSSLSVYKTSVSGTIPEFIYTDLPKLDSIRLYKSNFSGTISTQIGGLSRLRWLWIHQNEFSGKIPSEIGNLENLEGVTLHGNRFAPMDNLNDGNIMNGIIPNTVPESLCSLKKKNLKHLWTDCMTQDLSIGKDEKAIEEETGGKLIAKEGVQACLCCTRCFPQKNNGMLSYN